MMPWRCTPARRHRSGRSCAKLAVWPRIVAASRSRWNCGTKAEEVQFDLKDGSHVPAAPDGKRQHVVEIANFVDAGTSIWLHQQVGADFDAETLLEVVAQFFREQGLPAMLTFDNDPRFVGSPSGRDFPSALVRFLLCVGVEPNVIPPHRPDKNPYVERFHRTLSQECLQVHRPGTRKPGLRGDLGLCATLQ
jgi:Integrase core domain